MHATAAAVLIGASGAVAMPRVRVQQTSALDPDRLARLARGVNLSHWMWFPHAQGEAARRAYVTHEDLVQLARLDVTHVRVPFEPSWLWDDSDGSLRAAPLREYTDAMQRCLDAGLAVIVDAHWSRTPWIRPRGADYEARFGELERMWSALARHLADTDATRIFLELVNEPHDLLDAQHWHEAQRHIAAAVRRETPTHTIIATGAEYGGIDGLLKLTPLEDPNVVYSFHFYDPHNFTHQAAQWGFPPWRDMKDVPWPATREELERAAATFPEASANALRWSSRAESDDPWTPDALRKRITRAVTWAKQHTTAIYCGEFGVHAVAAPRESRLNWYREVTAVLREHNIGWAMWDYVGGFALASGEPGARTIDGKLAEALGLTDRP